MTVTNPVESHYASGGLADRILAALSAAGKDPDRLRIEDLAPVDEFHIRGREATLELAAAAGLAEGMRVLDVGSGVGGPSCYLAAAVGCRVTGLDLTEEYCQVAALLAERVGLADRVEYHPGDALAMPFANCSFDAVWTQHAAMNIADKAGLYAECRRVLEPGGALAIYDIVTGTGGPVHFPVPWAREPSISFLAGPAELRGLLEGAGFTIESWRDTTDLGRTWFRAFAKRLAEGAPPPLGFHLLMGPEFPAMAQNQIRNLNEDRIALVEVVARAP
jgi:MPBQ/MSBQ methyltransferase